MRRWYCGEGGRLHERVSRRGRDETGHAARYASWRFTFLLGRAQAERIRARLLPGQGFFLCQGPGRLGSGRTFRGSHPYTELQAPRIVGFGGFGGLTAGHSFCAGLDKGRSRIAGGIPHGDAQFMGPVRARGPAAMQVQGFEARPAVRPKRTKRGTGVVGR